MAKRSWFALLVGMMIFTPMVFATRKMTVFQVQQALTASQATHRSDDVVARQLSDARLTARMDSNILQSLVAISPGPKTTRSLRAVAAASSFLDLPSDQIPGRPIPDLAAQKAMLAQSIHYAAKIQAKLPNFLATRVTEHYIDSPHGAQNLQEPVADGLYPSAALRTPIAYRDGRESDDPALLAKASDLTNKSSDTKLAKAKKGAKEEKPPVETGMTSWGEFGPILGIVLVDAAKGKLAWAHWEQIGGKPVAVYQFSVDRPVSHYTVRYCCTHDDKAVNGSYGSGGGGRGGSGGSGPQSSILDPGQSRQVNQITGYHGQLAIDPETGTILRIMIQADLKPDDPVEQAAMMVEYGPVQIGDGTYFCPTRSVSTSVARLNLFESKVGPIIAVHLHFLNEVQYTDYRRFGSESTVITDLAPEKGQESPPSTAEASVTPPPAPTTPDAGGTSPSTAIPSSNISAESASTPAPPPISPPAAKEDQEILVRAIDSLPGLTADPDPANPASGDSGKGAFTLNVTTRLVDISLVAYDKNGKPITDLHPGQIEIYDNGRKQQIKQFQHATSPASSTTPAPPADTFTNSTPALSVENAPDLLILLLDESHLPFLDLNRARGEVLRFLKATHPDSRIALYSIGEHGFHVIQDVTQDRVLVATKLAAWIPSARAASQAQELETRNRQQIDTVRNPDDLAYVNGSTNSTPDYIQTSDPQLRHLGDSPLRSALESIIALGRHFASVPGHKSLVWISGDSALVDWEDRAVNMEKGDTVPAASLRHTREVLNEARIALYAVDASPSTQNGGAAVDASLANPSVQLSPVSAANSAPGGAGGLAGAAIGAGRQLSDMQVNTRAIQTPVRQLAEATGGLAINRGADLEKTLGGIEQHASASYDLAFGPDTPADNKYHTLQLKIPSRRGVTLRYRTGYLYNEEAASTKQRFQQAIWSPQDASAIELTAEPVPASASASGQNTVKLRIGFLNLALTQKADRWTDDLFIFVAVRDDATQKAQVSGETLRLSLKQASYESGMPAGIPYQRVVETASKLGSVRLIVIDANSGRLGSVTLPGSVLHEPGR